MGSKRTRGVLVAIVVVLLLATVVSCATLPSSRPDVPDANVPRARVTVEGSDADTTLTFGSYTWSYSVGGQEYAEELQQVGPQQLGTDELARLDVGGSAPVTVRFDVAPITAYVRCWDEAELSAGSATDTPLFWRARPVLDVAGSLGDDVDSSYEDGKLSFVVEPGRRYAVRATFDTGWSGSDRVEYVFTAAAE